MGNRCAFFFVGYGAEFGEACIKNRWKNGCSTSGYFIGLNEAIFCFIVETG